MLYTILIWLYSFISLPIYLYQMINSRSPLESTALVTIAKVKAAGLHTEAVLVTAESLQRLERRKISGAVSMGFRALTSL